MIDKVMRIYVETSVISGYGREAFHDKLKTFLEFIRKGSFLTIISEHTFTELNNGNTPREIFDSLNTFDYIRVQTTTEMRNLADLYLAKEIVSRKYAEDALHIAIATVLEVDYLVSWNMKHIVNANSIHRFNDVNVLQGYKPLKIRKPEEVFPNE